MTLIEAIPFSKKFTRDEISNMLASRKMDAIIANFVMGWDSVTTLRMVDGELTGIKREEAGIMYVDTVPNYSTDIAAAWQVVDKICTPAPDDCWTGPTMQINYEHNCCEVVFTHLDSIDCAVESVQVTAETAPLAICRAALLTMLED